jgi:hypothetical protein
MAQVSAAQSNYLFSQLLEIAKFDSKKGKITVLDDTSEVDVTYVGVAERPAKGSNAVWFITKIDESAENPLFIDTVMTITTSDPKVIWDNRLFIPYNAEVFETFDSTFDETFG